MGVFDWISSWFKKNEASMSPQQREEMRRMLDQLQLEMNESINTSSRNTMRKMECIINEQNSRLKDDFERQKSINDGQMKNMAKMLADLEAEFKKEKEKKGKGDDDLSKKKTTSLGENMDQLVKYLMNAHFMGPSGGYGPGPSSYGPGPSGYGPGPSGYGPGPNGHGPGPSGYGPGPSGYGPGPNGHGPGPSGYGPGPSGYGPAPSSYRPSPSCGVGHGPGPSGFGHGPGPSGVNYGLGPSSSHYGPGLSGVHHAPGPNAVGGGSDFGGRSRGSGVCRGVRRPSPLPKMTDSGPRLVVNDAEPNVTSFQTQRSDERAKVIQQHVEDFFNNAENSVSKDGPASLSRAAFLSNSRPMDLIMPESKDSAYASSPSVGKSSKTVQDWLTKNENPLRESEESENDGNSTSGRSIRSTRSTASFVGKRVFTNDSHNNSNQSKTAATKNKKSGKSRKNLTQNTAPKKEVKTDEDKNASLLKAVNYPSEEEAIKKKLNLRDPLKTAVMLIGKKEDGSMESHQPKCLAELYELEKQFETFKVITL